MFMKLYVISKQCWEKMMNYDINIKEIDSPVFLELLESIYDLYPQFDPDTDFNLFWQSAPKDFLAIKDWLSYNTSLKLTGDNSIYLLLNDAEKFYSDTKYFLQRLDFEEMRIERERQRSKYDVKIPGKESTSLDEFEVVSQEAEEDSEAEPENLEGDILVYALRKDPRGKCYTADLLLKYNTIHCIKKAMKGEIINCTAHKDIYFLETNTKNESTDLANLFAPPPGNNGFKYKNRLKLKQKVNPALEFFIQNKPRKSSLDQPGHKSTSSYQDDSKCPHSSSSGTLDSFRRRRSSIDLYEEAASILGLTCAETDDCKCLECQCHYFDFEEEIDFPTGSDCLVEVDHSSSCSIQ